MKTKQLGKRKSLVTYLKRHARRLLPFVTTRKSINVFSAMTSMFTGRSVLGSKPFVFKIEVSKLCNLRCPPCTAWKTQRDLPPDQRLMSMETYRRVLDQIKPYCIRASLYSNGEPLMNPNFYEMVRLASEAGISTGVSTNFTLFGPEDLEALFQSRLTHLEICLDGFTQEAYEHYRVGGDVEKLKRNIELVTKYKRDHHYRYPEIDIQVVKFGHIRHEIPAIIDFCEKVGVDSCTLREEHYGFERDLYPPEEGSHVPEKMRTGHLPKRCFWPWTGMLIMADGKVGPCCVKRQVFGDILQESLEEIWNKKIYVETRKFIVDQTYSPTTPIICFGCDWLKRN